MSATIGPVAAALIGGGGAIVGGVLTGGSNLLIDRSRATREAKQARTERARRLRQAARLVVKELASNLARLEYAAEQDDWELPDDISTSRWEELGPYLAAELPDGAWEDADHAYLVLRTWGAWDIQPESTEPLHGFGSLLKVLEGGLDALKPFKTLWVTLE